VSLAHRVPRFCVEVAIYDNLTKRDVFADAYNTDHILPIEDTFEQATKAMRALEDAAHGPEEEK
jgi:hypothetical protein